ncbi:MAG: DUF1667 domain-containing protein [Firmicutes bacterium]|jgi:CxxC motif-containing protein|nr:DUF1667 domain-containing protein [Bacillota bacterium]
MTELTCIVCPVGCRLKVEQGKEGLKIIGNGCRRGVAYARDEMTAPKRMLTAVVQVAGSERMLPVKTETAIPKAKIYAAMEEIKAITVSPPVMIGQVIKENLAESGVPLVATGTIAGEGCFKPLEKSLGSE